MAGPIDYKFVMLLSSRLDGFTVKSTNPLKVNCRCPLCGDSQKSKSKKRGWFNEYKGSVRFGCFNCSSSLWLSKFLESVDPVLADQYLVESKLDWVANNTTVDIKPVKKKEYHTNKDGLKKISQLQHDHPVKKYIEKRKIPSSEHYRLFYAPKFNKWINTMIPNKLNESRDEPRLAIPLNDKNGRIVGVTGRSFSPDSIRYITIMFKDHPKVFGLDVVDMDKTNFCVEGPIDSLFLDNAWAMAGADVSVGNENTVYVYDCEPRNKEIVARIQKRININQKVVIWPQKMENYGKDINDYVLNGLTTTHIQRIVERNTYDGLMAQVKLNEWKKV